MFKIGEWSRLCRVPVKTLRYYDEIGLLRPERVDEFSGYRYYAIDQLPRLNRILALKDLGFSLEQIAGLLDGGLTVEHMREILRMKQAELQRRLHEERERLARVEARLRQIEQEGIMSPYEVVLKQTEPQLVAAIRQVVPSYQSVGALYGELMGYLAGHGVHGGVAAAIWHDEGYRERDVDAEAVIYLDRPVPGSDRVRVYELPARAMASVVHHGSYRTLHEGYQAVMSWIEANGYRVVASNREIYLRGPDDGMAQDDEGCVTEIQFPVEKV